MSEEKKKKKKAAKIIAGIVGSAALIGGAGAAAGIITATTETETKTEEENEEQEKGKNNKKQNNLVVQRMEPIDSKVELSSALTTSDLGTIITNGAEKPTIDMIKTKLQTDIQNEVDIKDKDITDKSATISAKASSSKYKGNVTLNYIVDKKIDLSSIITNEIELVKNELVKKSGQLK